MFEHLQLLRARVRAAVKAFFSTEETDRITRERNRDLREAEKEREFLAKHWREISESQRFIDSIERNEKKRDGFI